MFDVADCTEPGPCLGWGGAVCREEAARTGKIGLQTWSPPLPGEPGSKLRMGGPAARPLSPGAGAHMKACHTPGTSLLSQASGCS